LERPFRHRLRVRYVECDPQGVVFNVHYFTYFDVAMTEFHRETMGTYSEMVKGEPTWSLPKRAPATSLLPGLTRN
jgi:acyl-CoA thioesterase FadM